MPINGSTDQPHSPEFPDKVIDLISYPAAKVHFGNFTDAKNWHVWEMRVLAMSVGGLLVLFAVITPVPAGI